MVWMNQIPTQLPCKKSPMHPRSSHISPC